MIPYDTLRRNSRKKIFVVVEDHTLPEPPDTPVPVTERMDKFKLIVNIPHLLVYNMGKDTNYLSAERSG
jgi:hypothetical protein